MQEVFQIVKLNLVMRYAVNVINRCAIRRANVHTRRRCLVRYRSVFVSDGNDLRSAGKNRP